LIVGKAGISTGRPDCEKSRGGGVYIVSKIISHGLAGGIAIGEPNFKGDATDTICGKPKAAIPLLGEGRKRSTANQQENCKKKNLNFLQKEREGRFL
jgi:hypothetical protein